MLPITHNALYLCILRPTMVNLYLYFTFFCSLLHPVHRHPSLTLPCPSCTLPANQMNRTGSQVADYHYDLPTELVAQSPAPQRDQSRLLVFHRSRNNMEHQEFRNLPRHLRPGDLLVLNDTRVLRARLRGRKRHGGGRIEILLGHPNRTNDWWCLLRPGKRVRTGTEIEFETISGLRQLSARVLEKDAQGLYRLIFTGVSDLLQLLDEIGEVPLPPYISRPAGWEASQDSERYQTVYARRPGAVAAPTAGLHFTPSLLSELTDLGVELCHVTLHVGLGTFAPIACKTIAEHRMHVERFELTSRAADQLNAARSASRRIVAVGTTVVRVLEHVAAHCPARMTPMTGETNLFIHPPYRFQVVDAMITNFHLPESTLLMLVSAFADPGALEGRRRILDAYAEAVRQRYRFFSYGDAMLLL
jgi:S-adenosylmethionine:tRNA ribosyltransferase-isomerase